MEQIAPQLPCTKGAGFGDHFDAGPAAALKDGARQPRHDPPGDMQGLRAEREANAFKVSPPATIRVPEDQAPISARSSLVRSAAPPRRGIISRATKPSPAHAIAGKLALHPCSALAFGKRDGDITTCFKLGRSDRLIGTEQSRAPASSIGAARPHRCRAPERPARPPLPHHRTGRRQTPAIATTWSRSWSLSASKT